MSPAASGPPDDTSALEAWLKDVFSHHVPDHGDQLAYTSIRDSALSFARVIIRNTPKCADRTAAIRKVREAMMTANAARSLKGLV